MTWSDNAAGWGYIHNPCSCLQTSISLTKPIAWSHTGTHAHRQHHTALTLQAGLILKKLHGFKRCLLWNKQKTPTKERKTGGRRPCSASEPHYFPLSSHQRNMSGEHFGCMSSSASVFRRRAWLSNIAAIVSNQRENSTDTADSKKGFFLVSFAVWLLL